MDICFLFLQISNNKYKSKATSLFLFPQLQMKPYNRKLFLYYGSPYSSSTTSLPPLHFPNPTNATSSPPSSSKRSPHYNPPFDSAMALTCVVLPTVLFFMGFFLSLFVVSRKTHRPIYLVEDVTVVAPLTHFPSPLIFILSRLHAKDLTRRPFGRCPYIVTVGMPSTRQIAPFV